MSMYNTSWIAGTPRTGSMLTFNLTREIFGINSKNIKPQHVPQEDEDMFACYTNEAMNDTDSLNKYVFKVHQTLRLDLPKSKYIVNVRNPFDICASFYEFMKCDFRHAMQAAKTHLNTIQHYQACPKDRIMFVQYDELTNDTSSTILKLSNFLECDIDIISAQPIAAKFSKQAVNKLIKESTKNLEEKLLSNHQPEDGSLVRLSETNYRAFDLNTGFQTGHISNRNSGEWKKSFNKAEISIITSELKESAEALGFN